MGFNKSELLSMGILEYSINVLNLNLSDWQITFLEKLQEKPVSFDIAFKTKGNLYGHRACYLIYESWKRRTSIY